MHASGILSCRLSHIRRRGVLGETKLGPPIAGIACPRARVVPAFVWPGCVAMAPGTVLLAIERHTMLVCTAVLGSDAASAVPNRRSANVVLTRPEAHVPAIFKLCPRLA
eukprot:jgi/Ulvmu1/6928/UM032_0006.1